MSKGHSWAPGLVLALLLAGGWAATGQSVGGGSPPGHVRTLRVWTEGISVHLTWETDPGLPQGYIVYRSSQKPSIETLDSAVRLAELGPDATELVTAEVPEGDWYYFVLSVQADGQVSQSLELAQNFTRLPLNMPPKDLALAAPAKEEAQPEPPTAMPPAETPPAETPPAPKTAALDLPPPPAEPSQPLASEDSSTPLTPAPVTVPLAPATAPDRASVPAPKPVTTPGLALAPTAPTPAPAQSAAPIPVRGVDIVQRESPLPYYLYPGIPSLVQAAGLGGEGMTELSPSGRLAVERFLEGQAGSEPRSPELVLPVGAEDEYWDEIRKAAEEGDWAAAQAKARMVLGEGTRYSGDLPERARIARWYLGISLASQGLCREALFELIPSQESYPRETKAWIDFCLARLSGSGDSP